MQFLCKDFYSLDVRDMLELVSLNLFFHIYNIFRVFFRKLFIYIYKRYRKIIVNKELLLKKGNF